MMTISVVARETEREELAQGAGRRMSGATRLLPRLRGFSCPPQPAPSSVETTVAAYRRVIYRSNVPPPPPPPRIGALAVSLAAEPASNTDRPTQCYFYAALRLPPLLLLRWLGNKFNCSAAAASASRAGQSLLTECQTASRILAARSAGTGANNSCQQTNERPRIAAAAGAASALANSRRSSVADIRSVGCDMMEPVSFKHDYPLYLCPPGVCLYPPA